MKHAIEAHALYHSYSGRRVLEDVSFAVGEGEIWGLLGPSGAGKTTLVRILMGQLHPKDGSAVVLGTDTTKLTTREHSKIGAMMDNYGLYTRLSVADNLRFYADILRAPASRVDTMLVEFGLKEARKTAVSGLSKGMCNRVCLARALLNDPLIAFLDEPTAGLDPLTTRQMHAILRSQREKGTTIFLTTHNMQEAAELCDKVALLHEGHIIEYGTPAQICAKHNHQSSFRVHLRNGQEVWLENDPSAGPVLSGYIEKGMVDTIHSTEPTLDDVFVKLTGRNLE